ncbi:MAG: lipid A export permease/ATP-binding protein MsbA [Nitrosomonadales bacterium]
MSKSKIEQISFAEFKRIYKIIFAYALSYKFCLSISIFFLLIFSLTNAGFLALLKEITDNGFSSSIESKARIILPISLAGLMVLRSVSSFISGYNMRKASRGMVADLRIDTFGKYMKLPMTFFDNSTAGILVSKITYEAEQLSQVITKIGITFIRETITIIALFFYMIYLDPFLTFVFLLMAPLVVRYIKKVSPKLRNFGNEVQTAMGEMTASAEEAVAGQRVIKVYGGGKIESEKFSSIVLKNLKMQIKLARLSLFNSMLIEIIASLALAIVVYYSLGSFTTGEFAAFVGALLMMIKPIKSLSEINESIQVSIAAAKSIIEVFDEDEEKDNGKVKLNKINGTIRFKNVSFSYHSSNNHVLKNISFEIKKGEKIALVGKSGGGKTTLINLIPRFYDTSSGEIYIHNQEISQVQLSNLRSLMSIVTQDNILFNDTVKNNIAFGVPKNKISHKSIKLALKLSNAEEFVSKMPDKENSIIGDRGVKLSGGQKQRLSIARAIMKDAPILLLDEATSALDLESEKLVQKALDNLMNKKTSIIIAHRLSTVQNADRIIVIDKGLIVEQGTHKQLLAKKGLYSNLYKTELI